MVNVFKDSTTKLPKNDPQVVRVDGEQSDIGGRKSNLPSQGRDSTMSIRHIPNGDGR